MHTHHSLYVSLCRRPTTCVLNVCISMLLLYTQFRSVVYGWYLIDNLHSTLSRSLLIFAVIVVVAADDVCECVFERVSELWIHNMRKSKIGGLNEFN